MELNIFLLFKKVKYLSLEALFFQNCYLDLWRTYEKIILLVLIIVFKLFHCVGHLRL